MSKTKRSYTAGYKRNTVKLSEEKGNVSKVSREGTVALTCTDSEKNWISDFYAAKEANVLKFVFRDLSS